MDVERGHGSQCEWWEAKVLENIGSDMWLDILLPVLKYICVSIVQLICESTWLWHSIICTESVRKWRNYFVELRTHSFSKTYLVSRCDYIWLCVGLLQHMCWQYLLSHIGWTLYDWCLTAIAPIDYQSWQALEIAIFTGDFHYLGPVETTQIVEPNRMMQHASDQMDIPQQTYK